MKMIDNWQRQALRMNSVQWMAIWSAVVTTWLLLPEHDQAAILSLVPFDLGERVPALMVLAGFIGGIFARLRAQPALHQGEERP
jgi:hypothetical protein